MEINEYVRTKDGKIGKYIQPELGKSYITNGISFNEGANYGKHSKDIIDLIENEDEAIIEYMNEFNKTTTRKAFIDIKNDFIVFKTTYETLKYYIPTKEWFYFDICGDFYKFKPKTNPKIISILTHEQFEANSYKIEKEV